MPKDPEPAGDMPKEITHWLVARRLLERLPDGPLATAARENPRALLLGAVFHDSGYYAPRDRKRLGRALADRLHGVAGEDTLAVVRGLDAGGAAPPPALAAFAAGLLSHVVVDSVFHPLVYYFTGNYYDPDPVRRRRAVEAHRQLETLLDLYCVGGLDHLPGHSLAGVLEGLELPLVSATDAAARACWPEAADEAGSALRVALRRFSRAQALFRRVGLVSALTALQPLAPGWLRRLVVLGYSRQLGGRVDVLADPIRYAHPVSGAPLVSTVVELLASAVAACVEYCARLEAAWLEGREAFAGVHGPSLEVGLPGVPVSDARHFHPAVEEGDYRAILDLRTLA